MPEQTIAGTERVHESLQRAERAMERLTLYLTAAGAARQPDAMRANLREADHALTEARLAVGLVRQRLTLRDRT